MYCTFYNYSQFLINDFLAVRTRIYPLVGFFVFFVQSIDAVTYGTRPDTLLLNSTNDAMHLNSVLWLTATLLLVT